MIFRLVHRQARDRAIEAIRKAPEGFIVTVKEPTRNLEQNAALHAEIGEIAGSMEWAGARMDIEDWKRLLTAAWCRATGRGVKMVPAIDGQGFDVIYQRTSTLGKSEMSELIDYIRAWRADHESHMA